MNNSICPQCGASFFCGAKAGEKECWCFKETPVIIDPGNSNDCLCKQCLIKKENGMAQSDLYVLLPDGRKSYLNDKIVAFHKLKDGMQTASGYPIKQDKKD